MHRLYWVTTKGQVTIPVRIRRKVGLRAKSRVTFSVDKKKIIMEPAEGILSLFGKGAKGIPKSKLGLSAKKLRVIAEKAWAQEALSRMR